MRFPIAASLAVLILIAGCGKKEEETKPAEAAAPIVPTVTGFAHDPAFDAAGYFKPVRDIVIGSYRLDHIAIGAPSDFESWEKGERENVYGPVQLEFEDITSKKTTNEMGQEVREVRVRVLPTAYKITSTDLSFRGADAKIGSVAFDGGFDFTTFAEAHKTGSSGSQPVLLGALTLGPNTIRAQGFTYYAGD